MGVEYWSIYTDGWGLGLGLATFRRTPTTPSSWHDQIRKVCKNAIMQERWLVCQYVNPEMRDADCRDARMY